MVFATTAAILLFAFGSGDDPAPSIDPDLLRRHIENLGSRAEAVRSRAAEALLEIGEPAIPALEETARKDPRRAESAGAIIDQVVWGVDLHRPRARFVAPDPELLDLEVLTNLGMSDAAGRNPILVDALVKKMREHDESSQRPTGQAPPLARELHALDRLRSSGDVPYEKLEQSAAQLERNFSSAGDRGRIYAMVAHVYGQSGCKPRTVFWARKALKHPVPPELRLRMYEYWYSAVLLQHRPASRRASAEVRRELVRPALFGLREAMRYDLPAARPGLPGVGKYRGDDPELKRVHRRQVQTRVVARFLREMVTFRDIHAARVAENCSQNAAGREELLERLKTPETVDALMRALRAGEDLGAFRDGEPSGAPSREILPPVSTTDSQGESEAF
jgi:hypothetical protein